MSFAKCTKLDLEQLHWLELDSRRDRVFLRRVDVREFQVAPQVVVMILPSDVFALVLANRIRLCYYMKERANQSSP
jgi:hypothetical protein